MLTTVKLQAFCPECLARYTNRDQVYGHPCPGPAARPRLSRQERGLVRIAVIVGAIVGSIGCATTRAPAPAVEQVGTLTPSYNSIAVAPLKHNAPPEMGIIVDTGSDDARETVSTETADAPEIVNKDGGLLVGDAR